MLVGVPKHLAGTVYLPSMYVKVAWWCNLALLSKKSGFKPKLKLSRNKKTGGQENRIQKKYPVDKKTL